MKKIIFKIYQNILDEKQCLSWNFSNFFSLHLLIYCFFFPRKKKKNTTTIRIEFLSYTVWQQQLSEFFIFLFIYFLYFPHSILSLEAFNLLGTFQRDKFHSFLDTCIECKHLFGYLQPPNCVLYLVDGVEERE